MQDTQINIRTERTMSKLYIPKNYQPILDPTETQRAIKRIKDYFQRELAHSLNLGRVSAPLFVFPETGLNDNLSGTERRVEFTIKDIDERSVEVVQSLAKWKRVALHTYGFSVGEGLYTDMSAIRRDDDMDNLHSIYVDQWDWEKVISREQRNREYLRDTVSRIAVAIAKTKRHVRAEYPSLSATLSPDVFFITSQELEDAYPELDSKGREYEIVKKHKTVFIEQIGKVLRSGRKHDGRAPDYDDWELNGDLLYWDDVLSCPIEISSMGIRVDAESLARQLELAGATDRMKYPYHRAIADGTLPLTIGGGIGQSRLCLLLLEKMHIGEVQSSIWDESVREECRKAGINLL